MIKTIFKSVFNFFIKHRKLVLIFTPIIIYSFVSVVFFLPKNISSINNKIFTPSLDPESFIWFLNWWPYAIIHHLNPFITKYIWYSRGVNLTWTTSIPTLAILMSPITLLFSAIVSFNLLAIFSLALSATSFFYFSYFITKKIIPSLFAGYVFGFSSFEIGQLLGHVNLYFTALIPLILLLIFARFKNQLSRKFFLSLLSLSFVLEFGISDEILVTLIFFMSIAFIILYLFYREKRKIILKLFTEIIISGLISITLLLPFIYYLILGYKDVPKFINSPQAFSSDLLNYIIPTPVTNIGKSIFSNISSRYTGNYSEEGAYLGFPLLIIIFIYFKDNFKKKIS